jgi:hypothetical protein
MDASRAGCNAGQQRMRQPFGIAQRTVAPGREQSFQRAGRVILGDVQAQRGDAGPARFGERMRHVVVR